MHLSALQISQLLPYFVLPHEGRSDEGMIAAITQVLITGKFFGDARCSAKMSILHYITLQPDLMLRETNLMLRLLKLVIKMQPDVNGQVSSCPQHCLLTCHVMEQQVAVKGHIVVAASEQLCTATGSVTVCKMCRTTGDRHHWPYW